MGASHRILIEPGQEPAARATASLGRGRVRDQSARPLSRRISVVTEAASRSLHVICADQSFVEFPVETAAVP